MKTVTRFHWWVLSAGFAMLLPVVVGCSRPSVQSRAELYSWMREHGLVRTINFDGIVVECAYWPPTMTDVVDVKQVHGSLPFQVMLTIRNLTGSNSDVVFDNLTSLEEFSVRIRDLALRFDERISMVAGNRRLKCVGAIMDYDIGLTNRKKILLTFPIELDQASQSDVIVTIDDLVVRSVPISFQLQTTRLLSMPEVMS